MEFTGMENARVVAILKALAEGVDPHSGAPLAAAFEQETVRALVTAIASIEGPGAPQAETAAPAGKAPVRARNSGKAWTQEEDAQLLAAFDHGEPVPAIAAAHGRSRLAIEARLARFDRIPMPAGLRQRANGADTSHASNASTASDMSHVARDAARLRYRLSTRALH